MGFTKSMIDKLLPSPVLKRNPHYASSAPMKLWREDDVRSVMWTQEFQTMAAKAAARKAALSAALCATSLSPTTNPRLSGLSGSLFLMPGN